MAERRTLLVRFDLVDLGPFPGWISTLHEPRERLVETPRQLALFAYRGANSLKGQLSSSLPILRFWQAACLLFGSQQRGLTSGGLRTNDTLLAQSIRPKCVEETGYPRRRKRARLSLDAPNQFGEVWNEKAAKQFDVGNNDARSIETFHNHHIANILRHAQYFLPSISSGSQCRISYRNLIHRPFSPTTSRRVCAWATLFNPGHSFGKYV